MFDLSDKAKALQCQLTAFMDEHIFPNEVHYATQLHHATSRFSALPLMDELKDKARAAGLWNLFVAPDHAEYCDHGASATSTMRRWQR